MNYYNFYCTSPKLNKKTQDAASQLEKTSAHGKQNSTSTDKLESLEPETDDW